jgi:endonuclease/exonuclease/phosphatase family metal-dependent hydrolase
MGSYTAQFFPPDRWWAPSMLGLMFPYMLAVNLLFVVFWLFIKPKYAILSILVLFAGWNLIARFYQFDGKETDEPGIRVISYNVRKFMGNGKIPSKENAAMISSFLKKNEPDIICLQEVMLRSKNIFNLEETIRDFAHIDHYQYASGSSRLGSVTMTRYPIVRMQEIRFENSVNIAICTDIVILSDTFRIFNVHLQSYRIDPERYDIIGSPSMKGRKAIRELIELSSKYIAATQKRAIQARMIRRKIDESPYPVLLCGDFNDTPASYSYRKTRGPLRDAFISSGKGIGHTYVGRLPSFRIDFIFHSCEFESYNFRTMQVSYSDHLPVMCEIRIKRKTHH